MCFEAPAIFNRDLFMYVYVIGEFSGRIHHFYPLLVYCLGSMGLRFSGTYRTESPRLLCSLGFLEDLGNYVEQSDDNQLHRWYAQFLESKAAPRLDVACVECSRTWMGLRGSTRRPTTGSACAVRLGIRGIMHAFQGLRAVWTS